MDFVARAAERGISAYVESNDAQHVQAAIEVSIRRYREAARLNEKVGQLESALERRAVIERAKGIVMERHGLDEREAFDRLRDHARAGNRRVVDVATLGRRGPRAAARAAAQGLTRRTRGKAAVNEARQRDARDRRAARPAGPRRSSRATSSARSSASRRTRSPTTRPA